MNIWTAAAVGAVVVGSAYGTSLYFGWCKSPFIKNTFVISKESQFDSFEVNQIIALQNRSKIVQEVKADMKNNIDQIAVMKFNKLRLPQKKIDVIQESVLTKIKPDSSKTDYIIQNIDHTPFHEPIKMHVGKENYTVDCIISITKTAQNINKTNNLTPEQAKQIIHDGVDLFCIYRHQYDNSAIRYPHLTTYIEGHYTSMFVKKADLVVESTQFAIDCIETACFLSSEFSSLIFSI